MRRNGSDQSSSLDLLLDTICNTFGGVLFISILVVVLVNMTSRYAALEPPTETAQAELVELHQRLAQTQSELSTLQTALQQQEALASQLRKPDLQAMVDELEEQKRKHVVLLQSKNEHLEQISRSQSEVNQIAAELSHLEAATRRAEEDLSRIEDELEREIQTRTRTAKLPTPRKTKKTEIPFFLREGRLCCYVNPGPNGSLVPNPAECDEKRDLSGRPYVVPKPGAGTVVEVGDDANDAVGKRIKAFDKDLHYLAVFVWPDSFAEFAAVRNAMVRLQFEYRLVPFSEGGKIFFGVSPDDTIVF